MIAISRRILLNSILALLLLSLSSCASSNHRKSDGTLHHIVLCWLKEPGNLEAQQKVIEATYSLEQIPGVIEVSAGRAVPSDRSVVDDSFDVGLVIVLEDTDVLPDYLTHPVHKTAIAEVLGPLTERIIIYDFEQE